LLRYTGVHVNGMILQFTPGVIICDRDALFTPLSVKIAVSYVWRVQEYPSLHGNGKGSWAFGTILRYLPWNPLMNGVLR
jgi:hypothetical protein